MGLCTSSDTPDHDELHKCSVSDKTFGVPSFFTKIFLKKTIPTLSKNKNKNLSLQL